MDKVKIKGGRPLNGVVPVSGAKNAALPILIASLLTEEACHFERVPKLQDIRTTVRLLATVGVEAPLSPEGKVLLSNRLTLRAQKISSFEAPYDLVRTMRASVVVLGPLMARHGHARVSLPGGCAIGARPIDLHLFGLEKLGAKIVLENGYVDAKAPSGGLKGARIPFAFPSVGATENVLMAAVLADGESILENCAREPEIVDLAKMLRSMGAKIEGDGTSTIRVQGVSRLGGCTHAIMADRIEAGTYLAAGFATQGKVRVTGIGSEPLEAVLKKFEEAGATVRRGDLAEPYLEIEAYGRPRATSITTEPFPGFPTDMQAQFMAVMCFAEGTSQISETIFENRFMHVSELLRLGADIHVKGNIAQVHGKEKLLGAEVMATDLRASASLIVAGLAAQGTTTVHRVYHLDRGYEELEKKLNAVGADVERLSD